MSDPEAAAGGRKGASSKRSTGAKEQQQMEEEEVTSIGNSFSVDVDSFSEECDLKVNNYRQVIHEEPVFTWSFRRPSSDGDEFKFKLTLRSETSSGRNAPRMYWVRAEEARKS